MMKFGVQNTVFVVVGVHLTAHDHQHKERLKQIDAICTAYKHIIDTAQLDRLCRVNLM